MLCQSKIWKIKYNIKNLYFHYVKILILNKKNVFFYKELNVLNIRIMYTFIKTSNSFS